MTIPRTLFTRFAAGAGAFAMLVGGIGVTSAASVANAADATQQPVQATAAAAGAAAAATPKSATLTAKTVTRAPNIDGRLTDSVWDVSQAIAKSIPETDQTRKPTQNASFDVKWDYENLYVAAHVTGDAELTDGTAWGAGDDIALYFDGSNHKSAPYAKGDLQIGVGLNKEDAFSPAILIGASSNTGLSDDQKATVAANVQAATTVDADGKGWSAEIAVPWSQLGFDAYATRTLGFDISSDNHTADLPAGATRMALWETGGQANFSDNTAGFGTLTLADDAANTVANTDSPVIYSENFDGIADGALPANVRSASGTAGWSVKDGKLNGAFGKGDAEKRLLLPAIAGDAVIDADVTFNSVANAARWASVIYRSTRDDTLGYYHFTNRLDGRGEVTMKSKANAWVQFVNAKSTGALELGQQFHSRISAFDQDLHHVRTGGGSPNPLDIAANARDKDLIDAAQLRSAGRIGVQSDQADVSFDNITVTQLTIDALAVDEHTVAQTATQNTLFFPRLTAKLSDGETVSLSGADVRSYSDSGAVVVRGDGALVAAHPGTATVTFVAKNRKVTRTITVTPSASGEQPAFTSVSVTNGKDLAEQFVGKSLALKDVRLTAQTALGTSSEIAGDNASLRWLSSDPSVAAVDETAHSVVFAKKGLVRLTAVPRVPGVGATPSAFGTEPGDGAVAVLDLWVRADADDLVYVQDDFESYKDGAIPAWLQVTGGKAYTEPAREGKGSGQDLKFDWSTVTLLKNVTSRSDYTIEADVTYDHVQDSARWGSFMYRIQNGSYPYFQMAVRQDATAPNGVEFAHRTPANGWDVRETGSFTEPIDPAKTYHFAVTVTGDKVKESIDGKTMIFTDKAGDYTSGDIGFQSNFLSMYIDNLKVTMSPTDLGPVTYPGDDDVQVKQASKNVAGGVPVVSTAVRSLDDVDAAVQDDITGEVLVDARTDADGTLAVYQGDTRISSLADFVKRAYGRTLVVLRVEDAATSAALAKANADGGYDDIEVVSDDEALLTAFRAGSPLVRSGLIINDDVIGADKVWDVVSRVNRTKSKHVILRQSAVTKSVVEEIQRRLISVTLVADDTASSHLAAFTAGANTVISAQPKIARAVVSSFADNTMLRRSFVIGHRGVPSLDIENSMSSYRRAVEEAGANMIETDVWITKDDNVVVIHDGSFARTTDIATNKDLPDSLFTDGVTRENAGPKDLTLDQIKKLHLLDHDGKPSAERVPTLDELLDYVKSSGTVLFLEIKDTINDTIEEKTAAHVKAKGVESQIVFITFVQRAIPDIQRADLLPGNSVGDLAGVGNINAGHPMSTLHRVRDYITRINATYNPSFGNVGGTDASNADSQAFVANAHARNMTLWPWTYVEGDEESFRQSLLLGLNGLTTNDSQWLRDAALTVSADGDAKRTLKDGESTTLTASTVTNIEKERGARTAVPADRLKVYALAADGTLKPLDSATVTAAQAKAAGGTLTVVLGTTSPIMGTDFALYSEPVTVSYEAPAQPGSGDNGGQQGGQNGGQQGGGSGSGDSGAGNGTGAGTGAGSNADHQQPANGGSGNGGDDNANGANKPVSGTVSGGKAIDSKPVASGNGALASTGAAVAGLVLAAIALTIAGGAILTVRRRLD